jgi:hypothetical protein
MPTRVRETVTFHAPEQRLDDLHQQIGGQGKHNRDRCEPPPSPIQSHANHYEPEDGEREQVCEVGQPAYGAVVVLLEPVVERGGSLANGQSEHDHRRQADKRPPPLNPDHAMPRT